MGQASSSGAAPLSVMDEGLCFQPRGKAGTSRACCDVLNCGSIGAWDEFAEKSGDAESAMTEELPSRFRDIRAKMGMKAETHGTVAPTSPMFACRVSASRAPLTKFTAVNRRRSGTKRPDRNSGTRSNHDPEHADVKSVNNLVQNSTDEDINQHVWYVAAQDKHGHLVKAPTTMKDASIPQFHASSSANFCSNPPVDIAIPKRWDTQRPTTAPTHPSATKTLNLQDVGMQGLRQDLKKLKEDVKKLKTEIELAETPRWNPSTNTLQFSNTSRVHDSAMTLLRIEAKPLPSSPRDFVDFREGTPISSASVSDQTRQRQAEQKSCAEDQWASKDEHNDLFSSRPSSTRPSSLLASFRGSSPLSFASFSSAPSSLGKVRESRSPKLKDFLLGKILRNL